MKSQFRFFALALFAIVSLAGHSQAQIMLDFDSSTIGIGSNETLSLTASGTDLINNITLVLVVEDGGATLEGTATNPPITGVTLEGLFDPASAVSSFPVGVDPVSSPLAIILVSDFTTPVAPGATPSPIASFNFDTTSLSAGDTFDLFLQGADVATFLGNFGTEVETVFQPSFTIEVVPATDVAVPEPSSALLLTSICGSVLLRLRRRV